MIHNSNILGIISNAREDVKEIIESRCRKEKIGLIQYIARNTGKLIIEEGLKQGLLMEEIIALIEIILIGVETTADIIDIAEDISEGDII